MANANTLLAYRLVDAITDHRLQQAGIPLSVLDHLAVMFVREVNANPNIPDVFLFTYQFLRLQLVKNKIFIPRRSALVTLTRFSDITAEHLRRALGIEEPIHAAAAISSTSKSTRRSLKKKKVEEKPPTTHVAPAPMDESQPPPCDQQRCTDTDSPPAEETPTAGPSNAVSRKRKLSTNSTLSAEDPVEVPTSASLDKVTPCPVPVVTPVDEAPSSVELPSCDELARRMLQDELITVTPVLDLLRSHSQCTSCIRSITFAPESVKEAIAPYWLFGDDPTDGRLETYLRTMLECVSGCKVSVYLTKIQKLIFAYRKLLRDPDHPLDQRELQFLEANPGLKQEYYKRKPY